MPLPHINPPLINSANPWATTAQDIQALFDCTHTGAVTTRTSLIHGFEHNNDIHQYTFFDGHDHATPSKDTKDGAVPSTFSASLNTLGYSPLPLSTYLAAVLKVAKDSASPHRRTKPFIVSVTGSAESVAECYRLISSTQATIPNPLCMEINLSCPNIPNKPPPAYSKASMVEYLDALATERHNATKEGASRTVAIGIKTPPYTYHDQFQTLIDALLETTCEIDFIAATNTLGSSLLLAGGKPAINSSSGLGIGGMAGASLHPLALGNVRTIRAMLDEHERLKGVDVIGVGGVSGGAGFERMRDVGAAVVGVGTALGREGVQIFGKILGKVR